MRDFLTQYPLYFFTDTFTGRFFPGFKLGWGHSFRSEVSHFGANLIPIRGSKISPHMGIYIILRNTFSVLVHQTQIVLGRGISLFGSKSVPFHRSLMVL
jgi:hypothetical protein